MPLPAAAGTPAPPNPPESFQLLIHAGDGHAWLRIADRTICTAHQLDADQLAMLGKAALDAAAALRAAQGPNIVSIRGRK